MKFETATQKDVLYLYRQAYQAEKIAEHCSKIGLLKGKSGFLKLAQRLRNKAVCMSAAVRLREQTNRPLKNIR